MLHLKVCEMIRSISALINDSFQIIKAAIHSIPIYPHFIMEELISHKHLSSIISKNFKGTLKLTTTIIIILQLITLATPAKACICMELLLKEIKISLMELQITSSTVKSSEEYIRMSPFLAKRTISSRTQISNQL